MKNDDPEVGPRQEERQSQRPVISNGRPASNNGHDTNEQSTLSNELAAEVKGEPTVSVRKIEANRRNARKSTGPKTARGKKIVSTNAIQHGFFGKALLVPHRDGKEDWAEYEALHLRVSEHYQPVGWLEESRVEEITVYILSVSTACPRVTFSMARCGHLQGRCVCVKITFVIYCHTCLFSMLRR